MQNDPYFLRVARGEVILSQVSKMLGWKFVHYDDDAMKVQVEYDAEDLLTNPLGCIQGGILSAMLDDAMGPAVYMTLPTPLLAVTIESKTSFISPAQPGKIKGFGKIVRKTGSIVFTEGFLHNADGELIATGSATFKLGKYGRLPLPWQG
ncbi:TPA: PaaI family thioesterase [Serratia rubidaea]|uniref:PaaI family thioesterase n=1 Tax=Serratia rubidaea TaxID=61652 RepID=UPI0023B1AB42|nr:PaaI family thioesterase [Serratia rubidaea]MDK1702680.1 PaaI family thioesterase [Serratia rubidaea]HDJ1441201.1 PaaI family thioesterase [Serratia rubidaea]HDJ1448525.1 PaaI family thioesterase [Serratia rubidaea]HDJ1464176.1 PaaI family thioesterase [Serratia rubidaea]HDJ2774800.1 PaaI family thioesterase [Serratia rubidaea]